MGWAVLFLVFDAAVKVLNLPVAVQATVELGYPSGLVVPIGIIELVCVALAVVRATSVPGAVLLTGYLGGAVASHARIGSPLLTHDLFPVYVGGLLWAGLWLRDARVRTLASSSRTAHPETRQRVA